MKTNFDFISDMAEAVGKTEDAPIVKIDQFDLDYAKARFEQFESKIKEMAAAIGEADIKDQAGAEAFTDTIGRAKRLVKDFENLRKKITGRAYNFYKDVLGFEKYYSNMVNAQIIRPANSKLSFYFKQIEIERQKAQKAAQEAAAKKQAELDQIADAAGVDRVELDKPIVKNEKPKIAAAAGSAIIREKWEYEVVNFSEIPREFLQVNDKAIKQAIKNGEREIAGLKIYKEVEAQVRSRR